MVTLLEESAEDVWEVEALYDLCFAPGREALSSYRLREGVAPVAALGRVARDGAGVVIGAIRYWPVRVGGHEALLLGPIAVHPVAQGAGVGGRLIGETMAEAKSMGHRRVLLVGDAPYYARFGFERLERVDMPPPTNPERVLGAALVPDAWRGVAGAVTRTS